MTFDDGAMTFPLGAYWPADAAKAGAKAERGT